MERQGMMSHEINWRGVKKSKVLHLSSGLIMTFNLWLSFLHEHEAAAIESDSQVILPQHSSCAHPYNWDWSIEAWDMRKCKWINNKGELEIENYYCCCGNRIGVRGECQAYVNKFLFLNTIDILKWILFL